MHLWYRFLLTCPKNENLGGEEGVGSGTPTCESQELVIHDNGVGGGDSVDEEMGIIDYWMKIPWFPNKESIDRRIEFRLLRMV